MEIRRGACYTTGKKQEAGDPIMQNTLRLSMNDLAPFVRYVQQYEVPTSQKRGAPMLNAYDHRLFYIYSGTGQIRFRDRSRAATC